ncbi:MAG: DUF4334 domain-containing protein [Bacteroidota bacterium]
MSNSIHEILANGKATTQEALEAFDSLETVSVEFMHGRWKGSDIITGHLLDGVFEVSGFYGKMFLNNEDVHPLVFFGADKKELYSVNPALMPLRMELPKTKIMETIMSMGRFLLETKKSKARLRNLEYRGRVSATMIYDDIPIKDTFVKIDNNKVLGVMDLKGNPEPFFFVLERDDHTEYEIAPLKAIDKKVKELFDMEIQNRAFALKSARTTAAKVSSAEDKYYCDAWVAFEELNQEKYAPFAAKYGLSQEPRLKANIEAQLGTLGIQILPESILYQTMLDQTIAYNEKLKELRDIAPADDKAFFEFVVDQEEVQIAGLQLCVEGKIKEAADLVLNFIKEHRN